MIKNEKFDLAIIFLISVLLSTYLFFQTHVLSLDGAFQYIPIAKDFVSGLYGKALTHNQQPLYSFFVAQVSQWVGDFEVAGKLVSSFFGILMIFPVYFLGKRIFDEKIAFLSTLFLVIHPYIRRFSADVLKESTYLFFLVTALWYSWGAIEGKKRYPYLLIPLFSVLAYLVRPDGVEILLIVFFSILFIKKFNVSGERWKVILLLLLSSGLFLLPYLIHLRESTGTWTLSRAKGMVELLGLGMMKGEASIIEKILFSLKRLNLEIFSIYHPLYLSLLIVGLFKRASSHFKEGEKFLLSFLILHYAVLFLLVLNFTDWADKGETRFVAFSGRHVLPLLLFSVYWVGVGFVAIYDWTYNKIESHRFLLHMEPKRKSIIVWTTLFILGLAIVLPKTLKPQRYERLPEKWAGMWIKKESGRGMTIFATVPRVAYYADGNCEYIDFNKDKIDKVNGAMKEKGALYLAIRGREIINFPEITEAIKKDFVELIRFEGKGMEKIIVYKRGSSWM